MGRLSNKVAIVTGAASGIGAAIAKLFVEEGGQVILTDLSPEGETYAQALGRSARFVRHDVTDEEGWRALTQEVLEREGHLDILVNNAGIGNAPHPSTPDVALLDDWRQMLRVNGEGTFLGCKYGIAAMRAAAGGSIVNMSSVASATPTSMNAAYGFSKAGVAQFTRSVAQFGAPLRIRCNSIHPGYTATPILQGLFDKIERDMDISGAQARQRFEELVPLGRLGEALDVAYGVLYFASDESRHVTGAQLVIDGGSTLGKPAVQATQ
ncbi:glucose 1-dehydrogenase [Flavisphingomonas formosensis]|uniref:glucose 1-dehydrogenase n=1 Tax=Flavisphingomonas formosensis TaxID=861534 RepID=UPI0012FA68F9|nr:glucose 1-dehydrogenase [Sphingomonas formosensis]